MDVMRTIILFDESAPGPSAVDIVIYTAAILIASNLIFIFLCSLVGVDSNKTLGKEKDKEFVEWKKKGVSPWSVLVSEIMNGTLYSPFAEELTFRLLLMKFICVRRLGMNHWTANIVQSIIFGIMHLSNTIYTTQSKTYTNLQTLSAAISGLVSGWVYVKCNSLIPSILAHMINNGAAGMAELMGYVSYLKKNK
jgi:membrane protease YdiL (CAAX protease family)